MRFLNWLRRFTIKHSGLTSNLEVTEELVITDKSASSANDAVNSIKQNRGHRNGISEYLDSKPSLRALSAIIPPSYFKTIRPTNKKVPKIFLLDQEVACDIFKTLNPHLKTKSGHIIEINAGAGILTEELLKAKLGNLRIYEPDPILCNHILKLIRGYRSDARLFMANLLALGSMMQWDKNENKERVKNLFDGVPTLNWEDEPAMKLIGALKDERFIRHIMFSIIVQRGVCEYGRPELFLILPPERYKKLKSQPSEEKMYKSSSVIFQILFDHEVLLRVPEKVFIPWYKVPTSKKKKNQHEESSEDLILVKLTPKKDLLQTFPPDLLKSFWIFVMLLMRKKSSLLIERMEKWIPGCGVRLILKGYTIFTECGSLTPDEYLKIFLEFSSWPEFYAGSFLPSAESLLSKVLQYSDTEEESAEKFNKLFDESNVSDEYKDIFDDVANLGQRDKSVKTEKDKAD